VTGRLCNSHFMKVGGGGGVSNHLLAFSVRKELIKDKQRGEWDRSSLQFLFHEGEGGWFM
jgi:hypothetical protein